MKSMRTFFTSHILVSFRRLFSLNLNRYLLFLLTVALPGFVQAKEIEVFVTNNPPLICMHNGELDCMAGTIIKNAAIAGGFRLKVREIPWTSAVDLINKSPNAVFASTGRNDYSESQYGWFFQVYSDDVFVWTLKDRNINSSDDLAKLNRINVRRGSPFGAYLRKLGYSGKVVETNEWTQAAEMLDDGRIDGMCLTGQVGRTNIIAIQKIPELHINRLKVGEISWWINTKRGRISPQLQEFQALLKAEKAKPYFQERLKNYGVRE